MNRRIAIPVGVALLALAIFSPLSAAKKPLEYSKVTSPRLHGFAMGADDAGFSDPDEAETTIARTVGVGAQYARLAIAWSSVAPGGQSRPEGFDAASASDPHYRWSQTDAAIRRLSAAGLVVYPVVSGAPRWASTPSGPSAAEFGAFARALATRYSGSFVDPLTGILPAVSTWQAWNEPNLPNFLSPAAPEVYRGLLNAFYDGIKSVQPGATVVAAGLAPVKSSAEAVFPKTFAAQLLCVRESNGWYAARRGCEPAKFDVFSVHPYSLGAGPTQRAAIAGNMFVADVGDVAQMLRAATQRKTVRPAGRKLLWSTEFAWFTNPPSKTVGDPPRRAGLRTLVALHELWSAGVSQVTWFAVSDSSAAIIAGGGLYDAAGRPKPTRDALRFPFYVASSGRVGYVWGRAPLGSARRVVIERAGRHGYRSVLNIRPRGDGLFSVRFKLKDPRRATFRASQGQTLSLAMRAARGL